jgi:hypothetical protein
MKMKKKWGLIVSVLMTPLLIASCATAKVYDKSVPLEQSSTLMLANVIINEFNGKKVLWMDRSMIIPADTHSLRLANSENRGTSTEYGMVSMSYTFLAGHTYLVTAPISGGKIIGKITDFTRFYLDFPLPDTNNPDASPFEGEWVYPKNENSRIIFVRDEWAMKYNGKYTARGLVSQDGENALSMIAKYDAKKEKWVVSKISTRLGKVTNNGTSLLYNNAEFKRLE